MSRQSLSSSSLGRLPKTLLWLVAAPLLCLQSGALAFDADSDSIRDDADAFPCKATASSVVFAPAQGQHGMVLFEDQWPAESDLDFNDAAVSYNYIFELNAQGQVLSMRATFNLLALGGIYNNGLALHIPAATNNTSSVRLTIGSGASTTLTPENSEPELTVRLLTNMRQLFNNQAGPINSDPAQPTVAGLPVEMEVQFATPVALDVSKAPFDLFIFRSTEPSHEIHRPEFSGTGAMDQALFHTGIDNSTLSRHFVDQSGLPFALVIPSLSPWTREGVGIDQLFPTIAQYAASGGTAHQDFYSNGIDLDRAFGFTSTPTKPGDPPRSYSVSDWTPPVAAAFVGPQSIPADTGCVNAWGLSVSFGTARDTFGYDSALDSSGNLIVTGYTRRSFVGSTNQGQEDIFVAKYRASGELLWSRLFGGAASETGRSVVTDAAGNIYVVGETRSSALNSQSVSGAVDAFLMKLDSNGAHQWTRTLGGSAYDYGTAVAVDSAGTSIYVGGGSTSSAVGSTSAQSAGLNSLLAKFDAAGTRQWVQLFKTDNAQSGNYSYLSDLTVDPSGNVVATGSERRYNRSGSAAENPFVAKLSSAGSTTWVQHLGDFGYYNSTADYRLGHGLGLATDSTGAIFVTGAWEAGSAVSSWASWSRASADSSADAFLVKLASDGTLGWTQSLGSSNARTDYGQSLKTDSTGNVYLIGYSAGTLPGLSSQGSYDYFAARFDTNGTRQWLVQNGTTSDDGGFAVDIDTAQGALVLMGNTGYLTGNPSAFRDAYYGFIARLNLSTGVQSAFLPTVDTTVLTTGCQSILSSGGAHGSGVYTIDPDSSGPVAPFDVYCDMTTNGGGWTLAAKFSNTDAKNWASSKTFWTSPSAYGTATNLTAGADAKSPAWSSVVASEFMLTDHLHSGSYVATTSNCVAGQTMSGFFTTALASFPSASAYYYKRCNVARNYFPTWAQEPNWSSMSAGNSSLSLATNHLVIAASDGTDTSGVISFYSADWMGESDVGLGALEDWNFSTAGTSQDVGGPTSCGYDDTRCRNEYPETVFMWIR